MSPSSPAFGVRAQVLERAHVVAPHGELDLFTVEQVEAALRARRDPCDVVVLDLRAVTFLDTSGMRLVVEAVHELGRAGLRFAVLRGGPEVQRTFSLVRLDDRLPFFDDLDAALAA
jgi:stage II sporulation protein AA (anti-sigma F factor antagonist)